MAMKKEFKLGLPITLSKSNDIMLVSDGFFNYKIPSTEFEQIKFKSVDNDGFITFEIQHQKTPVKETSKNIKASLVVRHPQKNGFALFNTSVPKAVAYGEDKSIYEYYKRDEDLSYYALIKRKDREYKRTLGSLYDKDSNIGLLASRISGAFSPNDRFDRADLRTLLPQKVTTAQKLKSMLDILTFEGFLERQESKQGERAYEIFTKTEKLDQFYNTPRPAPKPFGSKYRSSLTLE